MRLGARALRAAAHGVARRPARGAQLAICAALPLCAPLSCTPPPPQLPPALPSAADLKRVSGALLGVGDVVEVRVYQEQELTGLYRVESGGGFLFPLIGEVTAEGRAPSELAALIAERLRAGYLRAPQVTVFLKESNSKKVFILGQVKKPGTYRYEEGMSVVQAVALAGGLMPLAAPDLILIRGKEGDPVSEERFSIPFKEISRGRASNAPLRPGDILFVPESWL